jgi:NAD(P)-dependent dehydrogenase (short-subunit alcohol dehydrogenase family)
MVFITGASKGVGRATAISYAKAGASFIDLGARSSFGSLPTEMASAAIAAGHPAPEILSLTLDVQDRASLIAAVAEAEKAFGKLDILINNAGYLEEVIPVAESDEHDYWKTWEINYRGVYSVTKSFYRCYSRVTMA